MMSIQHARHTVETETIKLIFVHPEAEVAQEEAQDLMAAVVEQSAVPELMSAFGAFVEVAMIAPVKHVQTVEHVL